jgi:pimeloyl-ACP methyl ester carboxylesterase
MTTDETTPIADAPELAFTRLTPPSKPDAAGSRASQPPAIIFLHGAESCHLEFTRVATFLEADYDLLLVDLPAHSRSKHIPFSFDNAINGLVRLITTHVSDRKAHIVGLSLGGFVALELARRHPDVVRSVWCTGCSPFTGTRLWFMQHPRLLSGMVTLAGMLATETIFWATLGGAQPIPGLRQEVQGNQNMATLRPIYEELALLTNDNLAAIDGRVRVAMVAGGKLDNVADTKTAGTVLRRRNPQSAAFVVRNAIHWWSLQFPELFAQGVRAWIEEKDMPNEYEPLTTSPPGE